MMRNGEILFHTSPIIIFATTSNKRQTVRARCIARHTLSQCASGIEFKACRMPECNPLPYQMLVKGNSSNIALFGVCI